MAEQSKPWIKVTPRNNIIVSGDESFYISYNSQAFSDISAFASDGNADETALVKEGGRQHFYILNGDHREAYEELIDKGFEACVEYFMAHQDQKSSWSEEYEN